MTAQLQEMQRKRRDVSFEYDFERENTRFFAKLHQEINLVLIPLSSFGKVFPHDVVSRDLVGH